MGAKLEIHGLGRLNALSTHVRLVALKVFDQRLQPECFQIPMQLAGMAAEHCLQQVMVNPGIVSWGPGFSNLRMQL